MFRIFLAVILSLILFSYSVLAREGGAFRPKTRHDIYDKIEDEDDKEEAMRSRSLRGSHRDFQNKVRSLSSEQRKALTEENQRHRKRIREIMEGKI